MKKLFMLLALLIFIAFPNGAFAEDGDELTTTSFRVNSDGQVVYKQLNEVITTNDTVTAAETGKTFFINKTTAGTTHITLPTAATGLTYTFTALYGNGVTKFRLDPASTDAFGGNCVNSASTTTFANGDRLISAGATGDTVTIVGASTKWYCTNRTGTFVDAN